MLLFKNWEISCTKDIIARQYDNLSCTLLAVGDFPEGYTWDLLVKAGDAMDIITLGPMEGGMGVILTADQLSLSGYYHMQLRGTQGDVVRHTNVITAFIPASLSGDGQWPALPSEFTQMEARMRDIAAHPAIPGGNGYWLVWDPEKGEYLESEFPLPEVSAGGTGTGGGTTDHSKLINRDKADQHPMSAITGLETALEGKQPAGDYLTPDDLQNATNAALAQAKESGEFGASGPAGTDGVGIQSVEQTTTSTEDGGTNVVTVTKTDGTISTFEVRNGSRGSVGPAGADGKDGAQGPAGADGYTPVRGTDYWTADDIAAIKSYVDDAILGGAW